MEPIRIAVPGRLGLLKEIVEGATHTDADISVVSAPTDRADADVLVVTAAPDIRQRGVLVSTGKVIAVDRLEGDIDLYEMRPLGRATEPREFARQIRALARPRFDLRGFGSRIANSLRRMRKTLIARA